MSPDELNELIDDCIDHLCDDNAEFGAESLIELAHIYARAGMPKQVFIDMRQFIINSAVERLGTSATKFIQYKLKTAEQALMSQRLQTSGVNNGHIIIA